MAKIFVRNRRRIGKGTSRPRFEVVAVQGVDLHFHARHIRRKELEALAEAVGAEVVFLPVGDGANEEAAGRGEGSGKG